ncbi:FAD-dependent oxidoreductase, partial [Oleiphilus sp. HI0117]
AKVQQRYQKVLDKRGVQVHHDFRVSKVEEGCLVDARDAENPRELSLDKIIWAISASAPEWPKAAGLACSERGFIEVDACLQSVSHPNVFASGDIADVLDHPRPKAGVFAVRQGKPLADNLEKALRGEPLKAFVPQSKFLSL